MQHHPIHVVTNWLGNTTQVAMKHYLMTTEADFERALQQECGTSTQASTTIVHKSTPAAQRLSYRRRAPYVPTVQRWLDLNPS